ncbi:MAG: exosortase/archaeosortase family protein [Planctomycetota bacterium]
MPGVRFGVQQDGGIRVFKWELVALASDRTIHVQKCWDSGKQSSTAGAASCSSAKHRFWLATAVLLLGVGVAFPSAWRELIGRVRHDPEMNYVVAIPIVFVLLAWTRRYRLYDQTVRGAWVGVTAIALVVAGSWIAGESYVELFWFGTAVAGLVGSIVALMGVRVLSAWWPAILVLVLLVPLPSEWRRAISLPLELSAAVISSEALRGVGFDVQRLGSLITVSGHPVNVAEACGGTRMVMTVGLAVYAYVFLHPLRPGVRLSVLALTPLIALAANVGRVLLSVMMYGLVDPSWASFFHDSMAWVVMVLAYLLCTGIVAGWGWLGFSAYMKTKGRAPQSNEIVWPRIGWPVFVAALLLYGSALIQFKPELTGAVGSYHRAVAAQSVDLVPPSTSWAVVEEEVPAAVINLLQSNAVVQRRYRNSSTGEGFAFALVHCGQVRDLRNHHPPVCYRQLGWNVGDAESVTWRIGDRVVEGNIYIMRRLRDGRGEQVTVCNTFLLPGIGSTREHDDLLPLERVRSRNARGAAALQWVFDVTVDRESQDRMVESFLSANVGLIELLSTGPSDE